MEGSLFRFWLLIKFLIRKEKNDLSFRKYGEKIKCEIIWNDPNIASNLFISSNKTCSDIKISYFFLMISY